MKIGNEKKSPIPGNKAITKQFHKQQFFAAQKNIFNFFNQKFSLTFYFPNPAKTGVYNFIINHLMVGVLLPLQRFLKIIFCK